MAPMEGRLNFSELTTVRQIRQNLPLQYFATYGGTSQNVLL